MPRRVIEVRLWGVVTAFLGISVLFIVMGLVLGNAVARLETVRLGVCELRSNLETQITASRMYLDDIRAGRRKPIPGISVTDIRLSIGRLQTTVDALTVVECPQPKGDSP